jgi:hypothetical protein
MNNRLPPSKGWTVWIGYLVEHLDRAAFVVMRKPPALGAAAAWAGVCGAMTPLWFGHRRKAARLAELKFICETDRRYLSVDPQLVPDGSDIARKA